ncbi:STAS domain-containing protein [Streptomyces mirabilis]|uniref:STAS domain-containing protein n=1 Tax=Streptomyces mirabilis TaxID=68239 RepID=UPI0036E8D4A4
MTTSRGPPRADRPHRSAAEELRVQWFSICAMFKCWGGRLRCRGARPVSSRQPATPSWSPLSGEITSKNEGRIGNDLRSALRSNPRVLEIDLHRVTYLGSGGGRAFLSALRAVQPRGTRVIVTHTSAQARGVFSRLGVADLPDIYEGAEPKSE